MRYFGTNLDVSCVYFTYFDLGNKKCGIYKNLQHIAISLKLIVKKIQTFFLEFLYQFLQSQNKQKVEPITFFLPGVT